MRLPVLACVCLTCSFAQNGGEPPQLLQLVRRAGGDARPMRPYAELQAPLNVWGLTTLTGVSEAWALEAHDSFASIEELDKRLNPVDGPRAGNGDSGFVADEILGPSKAMVAIYRPDASYRPDQALKALARARYVHITIYRMRPGMENGFATVAGYRRNAFDTMNLDRPDMAYQVLAGAPSGTFLLLAPMASLRILDEGLSRREASGRGVDSPAAKTVSETMLVREQRLLRVEPAMSWVSDEFAAPDLDFWRMRSSPKQ
ncbi:hypothetical protein [Paludibaculum fermentans]|uniref:Uncharacterized protein n=1 Tax=Paludibaculum fermentans TaxID=1473598 RepID=A0A7S7NPP7_PALFE|nr:hypothetical protein [Paludibaculum fermentans]QOY87439.1 hypothetical protein IRI77_32550 [Paludibaculum fermentans]